MTKNSSRLFERLLTIPLSAKGVTPAETRAEVADRAGAPPSEGSGSPSALDRYLDKVAHAPYKVTDEDWQSMRQEGLADEAIFELTLAAALGAARHRLNVGLAALRAPVNS